MLFDILRTTNSFIKQVYLRDNKQINDECMKSFGEYIKYNKTIEEISLSYNTISDAGIEIFAPYLDGNTTFKSLYLKVNEGITDKSIPLLLKMIESSHIENLSVYATSITQKNMINIYVFLATNIIKYDSTTLDLSEK